MKKMRATADHAVRLFRMRQLDDVIMGWISGKVAAVFDRFAMNPIAWSLRMVAFSLFVVGGIFSFFEDKVSYWDGVWWAFVSMTTVGYGDLSPKTPEVRLMATFVIASGIVATALLVSALTSRVVKRTLKPANLTAELHDDFDEIFDGLEDLLVRGRAYQELLKERETNGDS